MGDLTHKGIVKKVSDNHLLVSILVRAACESCHAKGICGIADMKEKEIEITRFRNRYRVGDEVTVWGRESQGFKALFFGYLLPFILVLVTLILSLWLLSDEGISGLISLAILIPYYGSLYYFRSKLKKIFHFELKEEKI